MSQAALAHIWRHPVKGIGSEALEHATVSADGALEGDRAWALLTAAAEDSDAWQPRRNFLVVASSPSLAPITAKCSPDGRLTLSRNGTTSLTFDPATEGNALRNWVEPFWPQDRPGPARLVRAPGHGMTDMPDPFVSIGSLTALRVISQKAGRALDMRRFRINLWVDGLAPWEEFDLVARRFTIGDVVFEGAEPITRCRAPEANPESGTRDVNVLRLLEDGWGHSDFGLYARVIKGGTVHLGDEFALPS